MDTKKTKKADLENKKIYFIQIGFILSLSIILLAFEWKSYENRNIIITEPANTNWITEEIIIPAVIPPEPPAPKSVIFIPPNIVEDDIPTGDIEIMPVEIDPNSAIPEYYPMDLPEENITENPIFVVVEQKPQFPGGKNALMEYLAQNIKYPAIAKENRIMGTVYVTFVVEKDGSVSGIEILRGIGGGCDEEALRVVKTLPKWTPGKQRNKPVRVQFNLPIKFILQ